MPEGLFQIYLIMGGVALIVLAVFLVSEHNKKKLKSQEQK